jgi:hypothetical protein
VSPSSSNEELLDAIRELLGDNALPHASVEDKGYDLYEAFLFGLVVRAARRVFGDAAVWYETPGVGQTSDVRRLRTSPGAIHTSAQHGYTHAVIQVDPDRQLEVHLGIYVAGSSNVPHEADIAVIEAGEAERARSERVEPRSNQLLIAIEAKYYADNLPLSLGREYVGLHADLGAKDRMLVSSSSAPRVMTLLAARLRTGAFRPFVIPGETRDETDELEGWLATVFRTYRDR